MIIHGAFPNGRVLCGLKGLAPLGTVKPNTGFSLEIIREDINCAGCLERLNKLVEKESTKS